MDNILHIASICLNILIRFIPLAAWVISLFYYEKNMIMIECDITGYRHGLSDESLEQIKPLEKKVQKGLNWIGLGSIYLLTDYIMTECLNINLLSSSTIGALLMLVLVVLTVSGTILYVWTYYKAHRILHPKGAIYSVAHGYVSCKTSMKQDLYFCAALEDYEKYFNQLYYELHSHSDRINLYQIMKPELKTSGIDKLELEFLYPECSFFVIPITKAFLTTPSYARDTELPRAFELKIPVLLFAMESGLEEQFNQLIGDLQLIPYYQKETNPELYEQSLSNALSLLLHSPEELNKILDAFDANIFLSYRKSDHKLLHQLAKTIHSDKRLIGVSLWYDNYLIPGNDFQEEIADACKKCDLFTMLVTPRMLETPNYVMDIEYPMAVQLGKKILPFEAAETNQQKLAQYYNQIPKCISDSSKLPEEISRLIPSCQKSVENVNPSRLYYLGLAYLYGFYMERDYQMALNLLEQSASAGFQEAIEKLILIYSSSNFGLADSQKAEYWTQKHIN